MFPRSSPLFLSLLLFLLHPVSSHAAPSKLAVENHTTGSTVATQAILLTGTVEDGASSLRIANTSAKPQPAISEALVKDGRFKALVELAPGLNRLALKSDRTSLPVWFEVTFAESTNPYYLRLIWMTDSTGNTDFATLKDGDPQDYEARLRTAALLMQTFTAEKMNAAGYGPRTFRLERDKAGQIVIHTLKAPETAAQYATLDGTKWWGKTGQWLNSEHSDKFAKNMVVAAFTRIDPATKKPTNHTALGGGNLGLFGSASVFSWPRSLAEVRTAFADDTSTVSPRIHDDSSGRSVVWALASTTIGATLHEMGHTFDLPHSKDPRDIMTRGFDHFTRAFTLFDAPRKLKPKYDFRPDEEAYWAPVSASSLRWNRWFAGNDPQPSSTDAPTVEFNKAAGTVTLASKSGLRWAGFVSKGDIVSFREFTDPKPPKEITLKLDDIRKTMNDLPLTRVTAIGTNGEKNGTNLE